MSIIIIHGRHEIKNSINNVVYKKENRVAQKYNKHQYLNSKKSVLKYSAKLNVKNKCKKNDEKIKQEFVRKSFKLRNLNCSRELRVFCCRCCCSRAYDPRRTL